MMSFEEFRNEIRDNILGYLPESYAGFSVKLNETMKNNGALRCGISIYQRDEELSPLIYLEEYYQRFRENEDIVSVLGEIANAYEKAYITKPDLGKDFLDYEKVRDKIVFRLVNSKLNKEQLKSIPHKKIEDLTQVFQIYLGELKGGIGSIKIENPVMEKWGISLDELAERAAENTKRIYPPIFVSMGDTMAEMMGGGAARNLLTEKEPAVSDSMYILSNEQKVNGAAAILYPELLENVRNIVGSDFYIIPSSVHEVLIVPKGEAPAKQQFGKMVREVNADMVDNEEILSDCIYEYSEAEKSLKQVPESLPREKEHER